MRKLPVTSAVLAVLGISAAGLVGCSPQTVAACERPAPDTEVADLVTVTGAVGSTPEVDLYTPFHVTESASFPVESGAGTTITTDAQVVGLDLTIVSGSTGETVFETGYDGSTAPIQIARLAESIPALSDGLLCAAENSRTVIALGPGDVEPQTAASLGLTDGDSAVLIADVGTVYLASADGDDVFNAGHGMPTVVRDTDGRPGIIVPDSAPPSSVEVQTLKRGRGDVVTDDTIVRVQYTGVVWETKEEFQTTWDTEPASVPLTSVVPGFAQAVTGQTVGSQVLVAIPPEFGYGDEAQGTIPPGSTLVFVIDILGIDPAPMQ